MARINLNNISQKINKIVKGRMASGGLPAASFEKMGEIADAFIQTLRSVAAQKKLPDSVLKHFDSLEHGEPYLCNANTGEYQVDVRFRDDLSRMSLKITSGKNKGQRTGNGIDNIVSLFDSGYNASKRVYGQWGDHFDPYAWEDTIASRVQRDGLNFMKEAIDDFNNEYGTKYMVRAFISAQDEALYPTSR